MASGEWSCGLPPSSQPAMWYQRESSWCVVGRVASVAHAYTSGDVAGVGCRAVAASGSNMSAGLVSNLLRTTKVCPHPSRLFLPPSPSPSELCVVASSFRAVC